MSIICFCEFSIDLKFSKPKSWRKKRGISSCVQGSMHYCSVCNCEELNAARMSKQMHICWMKCITGMERSALDLTYSYVDSLLNQCSKVNKSRLPNEPYILCIQRFYKHAQKVLFLSCRDIKNMKNGFRQVMVDS